nr:ABC transporter ATP-binding protein [Thermoleophilaceae bacterium]
MTDSAPSQSRDSSDRQAATLEFRNVTKRYPGTEEAAVEDLSLEVPAGEICV